MNQAFTNTPSTVEPLYYGHFGTLILVLITEVSSIQRSLNTLHYYTGTQNGILTTEVSAIQRFVIERFHCTYLSTYIQCMHVMYITGEPVYLISPTLSAVCTVCCMSV